MLNTDAITQAIIDTEVGPIALEEGAALVESWINEWSEKDAENEIIAVEVGFSIHIDTLTWIIGVQDLIFADAKGIAGSEWKTTKEPGRYWSESKWLESIKTGPQIAVYALALHKGVFYEDGQPFVLRVPTPVRERVRAVVKTATPLFWPVDPSDGWQEFDERSLRIVENAFKLKAEMIRAARRQRTAPWQLTGRQCHEFNRACDYFEDCKAYVYPEAIEGRGFDADDPAAQHALPFLPAEAKSDDAVILSASSYADYTRCMELGRRNAQGEKVQEAHALNVGTVLHAGVAAMYKQIRDEQKKLDSVKIEV